MPAALVFLARTLVLAAALLALPWAPPHWAQGLAAEDSSAKDANGGGGAGAPANAPAKDAPLPNTTLSFQNDKALELLKGWANQHNLNPKLTGTDRVQVLTIGAVSSDLSGALAKGVLTINGLEYIFGDQETFIPKKPNDGQKIVLALFASKGDCSAFIDDMRSKKVIPAPDGVDLLKKTLAWPWPRVMISCEENVKNLLESWAVYSVSVCCVDAFFNSRNPPQPSPTWLREGIACDMQQTVCKGIHDVSIAYEDKQFPSSDNWAKDIKKLLDSGSPSNKDAGELMRIPLDSCPNVFYQQFWSLVSYIRTNNAIIKGPRNKMRRLFDAIASGQPSMNAFTKVYGQSDQQLTRAWRLWAYQQR